MFDLTQIEGARMSRQAYDINSSGLVCADGGLLIDVALTPMTATLMPPFPGYDDLTPLTINDNGDVAGTCTLDGAQHGFLYRARAGPIEIWGSAMERTPGIKALAVDAGLGGALARPTRRPRRNGSARDESQWRDIERSMDGTGMQSSTGQQRAFLFQDGILTDLNDQISDPSWDYLFDAAAINNAGQIVGTGYCNGDLAGFLLTPVITSPGPHEWEALLQWVQVSFSVMAGGSGWSWHGPVRPRPLAMRSATPMVSRSAGANGRKGAGRAASSRPLTRSITTSCRKRLIYSYVMQLDEKKGYLRRGKLSPSPTALERPPTG